MSSIDNVPYTIANLTEIEETFNSTVVEYDPLGEQQRRRRHLPKSFGISNLLGELTAASHNLLRIKRSVEEPDSKGRTKAPPLSSKEEKLMESQETNTQGMNPNSGTI